jgi:Tol biopolymer transport system component
LIVTLVALALAAATATLWTTRRNRTAPAVATMVPLVTWPGEETGGRLSPDGKWASFCATHAGRQGVWAVPTAGGEPQLLVTAAGQVSSHAWSPDGEQIAVLSHDADDTYLRFVPAFGGAPRASVRLDSLLRGAELTNWIGSDIYIEVARRGLFRFDTVTQRASAMWSIQRGTGVTHIYFDVNPARGTVTSTRIWESNVGIAVSRLDGREMRVISDSGVMEFQSRWLGADGRRILYSSGRGGQIDLWQMDVDQRFASQVTFSSASERVEATSRDGALVLMSQTEDQAHLWRVDPASPAERQQLTADLLQDAWPAVAPGQSRIVFQRNKPRQQGVLDVGDAQILAGILGPTGVEDASALVTGGGCPIVSPSGKWLAYSRPATAGGYDLWIADLESRHTWRAATGFRIPDLYSFPVDWVQRMVAWSADDRTLYFVARAAATTSEIRRLAVDRDATESTVMAAARSGLYGDLVVSPDGRAIVCTLAHRDGRNELHWISVATGTDRVLLTQSSSGIGGFMCARGFFGPEPAVVVLRGRTRADFADDAEILTVPAGAEPRRLAAAERVFAGTARLDSRRGVLYVVGIGAHDAHNVVAFELASGRQYRVTGNSVAGISYAGIEVLDDGDLILAEQKRNEDLMLIRFDAQAEPRSN